MKFILDTAHIYKHMIKYYLETGDFTGMKEDHLMIHVQRPIWVNPGLNILQLDD